MGGWKQIAGDMTWERHGVVLARVEPEYEQVHLVRITPWMEHDREAAVTHGLYLVDEHTVDFDDLDVQGREVDSALRSVGMDESEYEDLAPEYKAEIIASYAGYPESRSVNSLVEALPADPAEIAFWGGKETEAKLKSFDEDLRKEVFEANFETRFSFGELPTTEAIEFALGGEPFEMSLGKQDELAFLYATAVAGVSGSTDTAEHFARTVRALAEAPSPSGLRGADLRRGLRETIAEWEERYGDPDDEDDGIAAAAQQLGSSMMTVLGFEWV
jgi:hypothetical protein